MTADPEVWVTYGSYAYDLESRNPDGDPRLGAGIVDADAAVTAGATLHPVAPTIADDAPNGRFAPWLAPLVVVAASILLPAAGLALVRRRAQSPV